MSVYKDKAARSVPMENIYIPLAVIANGADDNDPNVPRRDPIELLAPGLNHVVLGDPVRARPPCSGSWAFSASPRPCSAGTDRSERESAPVLYPTVG